MDCYIVKIKRFILNNINLLPNFILLFLMKFNRDPNFVYGSKYRTYREILTKNDKDKVQEVDLLTNIVNRCRNEVPYYKNYEKFSTIEDFEDNIPFIDKDKVLADFNSFLNSSIDLKNYDRGTTGGTSGKPLRLVMPPDRYIVELATIHHLWSKVGYDFSTRAVIRNAKLPENKVYTVNPITKEIIFDGFKLNDEYFEKIYRVLLKNKVEFIHCYPSVAYTFSKFLYKRCLDTSFLKAFLCSSENMITYQKEFIESSLGIRLYSFYGHSEKLVLAGNNIENNNVSENYKVESRYGYFELIDENGKVIKEKGILGEIVGTTYHNIGMPLIRYRTGDFASYIEYDPDKDIKIIGPIKGRWLGEKIYNDDMSFITPTALNLHSELYEKIDGLQYRQTKPGFLEVLIIKGSTYDDKCESILMKHFKSAMKAGTIIEIIYVEELIKQKNGKFLLLLSSVKA